MVALVALPLDAKPTLTAEAQVEVVAVNPLQNVPDLYTEAERRKYARAASERAKAEKESRAIEDSDLPPHIYSVGQAAYKSLMATKKDQSVAFIGRSGSGKTTNFKHVLTYLASVAGSSNNILNLER